MEPLESNLYPNALPEDQGKGRESVKTDTLWVVEKERKPVLLTRAFAKPYVTFRSSKKRKNLGGS